MNLSFIRLDVIEDGSQEDGKSWTPNCAPWNLEFFAKASPIILIYLF
ncbi:hypothetical protein Taro_017972 [Colocasia esculenta]|uniref:Uncharacterized protein n=1 Tax=Colocasia esculenta TaxID=4460 RepID=A0A843USQ5_COLES|nr:hypothetical protein [Colocasia esculenta]